jgi:hypothetical protein
MRTRGRRSTATNPRHRQPGAKPTRELVWRTVSFSRARQLLVEAEDAQAQHDQMRLNAIMDRLRSLPGFPRDMQPTDRLIIEQIPPIISTA